jgi:rubrerythrin
MSAQHTLDTIFDLAISRETAANKLYTNLASRVKSPAVKEAFESLAKEELRHKTLLTTLKAEPLTQARFKPVTDYHIAETEAQPEITPDMPLRDAVALAMKNEQQAAIMYRGMAELTSDADMRTLFENLTNMELGHKSALEDLFIDIGYPEVF